VKAGRGTRGGEVSRAEALRALRLDVSYERGEGSRLWYRDATTGEDRAVWDFLGGYGSIFHGHNHPELVAAAREFLDTRRVFQGQASVRSASEALKRQLGERLRSSCGIEFTVLLANTGSEAVEVAARHAGEELELRRLAVAASLSLDAESVGESRWSPGATAKLTELGLSPRSGFDSIDRYNRRILGAPAVHLALRGAYHGMTAMAFALTDDPEGRFGHRSTAQRVRFIDPGDPLGVEGAVRALTSYVLRPRLVNGLIEIDEVAWAPVASLFFEPIQGEGGIRPVDPGVAAAWRRSCDALDIPMIADEIQCGLGRTGTFLYCEQIGLRPDYVLLGKSLGGGIAKLSAVAIAAGRAVRGFTLRNASTFAGDDFSSSVAGRALQVMDAEGALPRAKAIGADIEHRLRALACRHPDVVADVRGTGLMLGIEWRPLDFDRCSVLCLFQEYGWLGYALSSYLLHRHGVRVAPTLAGHLTTRIEPAYDVPGEAVDRLFDGLEDLCEVLEARDSAKIVAACMGAESPRPRRLAPRLRSLAETGARPHVGFVGHFIDASTLAHWDPDLERVDPSVLSDFLERVHPLVEPVVVHRGLVRSADGTEVALTFIGLAVPSERFFRSLRSRGRRDLRALVQRAVDMAADEGCSVVGLGGYTSIVTRNGRDVEPGRVALTTGNGYTVGASLEALRASASELQLRIGEQTAAVVGATGNIGSVLSELLATEARSLVLIGRAARTAELEALAGRILLGLAEAGASCPIASAIRGVGPTATPPDPADYYRAIERAMGGDCPITVGSDLELCRAARVVVSASNQAGPLLLPRHLACGEVVVADLSVPADVHPSVRDERPDVRVVRGGVVRTPANPDWALPGIPLEAGEMYACMTETVLMGLEGNVTHGSLGALTPGRVRETVAMAERHGFSTIRSTMASSY